MFVGDEWIAVAAVERFVLAERRLPLICSTDEEERNLAEWLVESSRDDRDEPRYVAARILDYVVSVRSRTRHLLNAA